jgi:hypothetical protein
MRSASVTGSRAARTAGSKPRRVPMTSAHTRPCPKSRGVTRKSNATWENVLKLRVESEAPTVDIGERASDGAA